MRLDIILKTIDSIKDEEVWLSKTGSGYYVLEQILDKNNSDYTKYTLIQCRLDTLKNRGIRKFVNNGRRITLSSKDYEILIKTRQLKSLHGYFKPTTLREVFRNIVIIKGQSDTFYTICADKRAEIFS